MWAWLILDDHPRTCIEDIILCVWEQAGMYMSEPAYSCTYESQKSMLVSLTQLPSMFFPPPYPFELRVFHWTHLFPPPHPKSWHCRRALPCPRLWVLGLQTKVLGLHNQYFTYWAQRERIFAGRLSFSVGACLHTRDTPDMCGPCHKVFICDSSLARAY